MPSSEASIPAAGHSLDSISEYIQTHLSERRGRAIPPLDQWHPEKVGNMDLTIKANGDWWHEGSIIKRQSLIDLFATVLWAEHDEAGTEYYLKTPVEKLRITVEDVPFMVSQVNVVQQDNEQVIEFMTTTGDVIYLDDDHPLEMHSYDGEDRPYIDVRYGMKALISRNVFMHLIKLGTLSEQDDITTLTLQSGGKPYTISVPNA